MDNETTEKTKKAAGWIEKVLTGWGVPGTLARIIAGAIVGAVAAWYVASSSGCTVNYSQGADGTVQFQGHLQQPREVTVTK